MSKKNLASFCAASAGVLLAAGWLTIRVFPLQAAPAPQETQSNLLHSVAPIYPAEALEKHIEGDVLVDVQIDAKGNVTDARVLSGPEELRNAALQAVLQWHYSPAAMSLPATAQATVKFHIPQQGEPEMTVRSSETVPQGWHGVLQAIRIEGLPESTRDELTGKLPVHVGDSVDASMIQSLNQSVHTFDSHLNVSLAEVGPGQMVIRIYLPGKSEDRDGNAQSPKIRVGGNIQQSKLLVKQAPIYPPEAKEQRVQGLVRLEATIGKDGRIENLVVVSGEPVLAAAAMEAVRNWQYAPTLLNGDPVEVVTTIDVNFTLSK